MNVIHSVGGKLLVAYSYWFLAWLTLRPRQMIQTNVVEKSETPILYPAHGIYLTVFEINKKA
jgi:hypothetical protein